MIASKSPSNRPAKSFSFRLWWLFFIGYAAFLYLIFTLPPEQIPPPLLRANDKVLHFLDFFILVLLAFQAFFYSPQPFFYLQAPSKAAGFSLCYGAFLEGVQLGVPGRQASFMDWIADALGVLIAVGILRISKSTRTGFPTLTPPA